VIATHWSAAALVRAGRRLRVAALVVLAFSTPLLSSCDARGREIRARLSDEERLVFDRGNQLASPCWTCHDFYGTQNKVGPQLSGLVGRRAGESTYGGYSDALRRTGVTWDRQTLDAFLAEPQRFAPGTTMISPGVADPADRAALLFYIEQVTASQ
jgi:cytochrome c